jgi:dTDP-4-dehydrorhamnose reductase
MPSYSLPDLEKVLVLGAHGQLGQAFKKILDPKTTLFTSRVENDLSKPDQVLRYIESVRPTTIINAAAYTQVDRAEIESDLARAINATSPGILAQWCQAEDIPFVHFSTDYVFSGLGSAHWKEDDPILPINSYGRTKAEGDKRVQNAGGKYLIFRTSWVYDILGKNFLRTILKLAAERETLRIVHDQIGAPTFAEDLAVGSWKALNHALKMPSFPSGTYHLCNQGEASWYQFAQAILDEARNIGIPLKINQIEPISSSEYPTPAQRPLNSRLDTAKVYEQLGVQLPHWRESLKRGMRDGFVKERI